MTYDRRSFLHAAAAGAAVGVTGCLGGDGEPEDGGNDTSVDSPESDNNGGSDDTTGERGLSHEPWATFGNDAGNSGHAPNASPPSGESAWTYETDGPIHTSLAVVDGTVYVPSFDESLHAVNAATGEGLWTFDAGANLRATPAVDEGLIFQGSDDNSLYGVTGDGAEDWRFEGDGPVRASPKILERQNDRLVVFGEGEFGTGPSGDRRVLQAATMEGDLEWQFRAGGFIRATPAIGENAIYVPRDDGVLYSVDPSTAEQNWFYRTDGNLRAAPAVRDGRVIYTDDEGNLVALREGSEEELWTHETDSGIRSSPSVSSDTVYFGDENGTFHAVSTEGDEIWTYSASDSIRTKPAIGDGYVAFGSDDSSVYALDTEGEELWTYETGGSVRSSPVIIDGQVFVGSFDNSLHAIE